MVNIKIVTDKPWITADGIAVCITLEAVSGRLVKRFPFVTAVFRKVTTAGDTVTDAKIVFNIFLYGDVFSCFRGR